MRIDKLYIEEFKNLHEFNIDFAEEELTSVLIGKNGIGKSNIIEAIVILFRDIDLNNVPEFTYKIKYICNDFDIKIEAFKGSRNYQIRINDKKVSFKELITKNKDGFSQYLPRYVFAYYSGTSKRLEKLFTPHQNNFYKNMLNATTNVLRPFFYARLVHSFFVLLSFFSFPDKFASSFLKKYLNIVELDSVLFVLKKPNWDKKRKGTYGLKEFWGARGVVRSFIDELYKYSLAPVSDEITNDDIFSNKKEQVSYLYLKDEKVLNDLSKQYLTNKEFFKHLESTYLSDLIYEVRIRVKKTDGSIITFNELSEGEQQLITVFGLLKFTKDDESLFLLDEPDTHLNPSWKFEYLKLLKDVVGGSDSSQLIISTHDPLVIGGLYRDQVTVFNEKDNKIYAKIPDIDPKGMGVAGLLTSELFGLRSTLDPDTQSKIDRKRELMYKKDRSPEENDELKQIENELGILDYTSTTRDPLYAKFVKAVSTVEEFRKTVLSPDEIKHQQELSEVLLKKILEDEKNEMD